MTNPAVWSLDTLLRQDLGRAVVWAAPSVRARVEATLPWPIAEREDGVPAGADTLVVVGGGTLIDRAKALRHDAAPALRLVAIPSIWGSGAEASPFAVLTHADAKEIRTGDGYLPDARVEWPELIESVPASLARYACGDVWAHAIEGFLSPLASADLRRETAALITDMLALPLAADARWLEASARACAAQARSSVGLVHGIAHVLEPVQRAEQPNAGWGHARLCATYLWPALAYMRGASPKVADLTRQYDVDLARVEQAARALYHAADYDATLPALEANWRRVLRDPCTRTSCVLVRTESLAFFTEKSFR